MKIEKTHRMGVEVLRSDPVHATEIFSKLNLRYNDWKFQLILSLLFLRKNPPEIVNVIFGRVPRSKCETSICTESGCYVVVAELYQHNKTLDAAISMEDSYIYLQYI